MKLWLGGEDKVDGRLLALLRVMYCRDRRLLALSNVTYASLQAYNTPFRIATFERRAIMHALVRPVTDPPIYPTHESRVTSHESGLRIKAQA